MRYENENDQLLGILQIRDLEFEKLLEREMLVLQSTSRAESKSFLWNDCREGKTNSGFWLH